MLVEAPLPSTLYIWTDGDEAFSRLDTVWTTSQLTDGVLLGET